MKKKVLFVIHQLNYGGVQKALLAALNTIDYSTNEVTLYIRKNRIDLIDEVNLGVSRIIVNKDRNHYYRKPYMVYLMLYEFFGKLFRKKAWLQEFKKREIEYLNESQMKYEQEQYFNNDEEYDIAISYIQGYTAAFVAQYIRAKKKVMFFHGSTDENHELHDSIMSKLDCIIGVNESVKGILQGLYPVHAAKISYIENYVDVEAVRSRSQEMVISREVGKNLLCSCGRITPVKGFDIAVNAAHILRDKGLEFVWYFVGDGPERYKIEHMIEEAGLRNHIIITGMQENPYPFIKACDIYVQPSREEAHPLTIIEALILGCPVVTTSTIGGQAIIRDGENGKISLINETALAEAIVELLEGSNQLDKIKNYIVRMNFDEKREEYQKKWRKLLEGK